MEFHQFQEIFLTSLRGTLSEILDLRVEALTSFYLEQTSVQDSFRYRARHLALRVAGLLLDEKGELREEKLSELNTLLGEANSILGPNREADFFLYDHLRNCLLLLSEKKEIWNAIRKFSPPLCHKGAEEVVRETLYPETFRSIETVHVRKAVLAAWFTFLRQTTGSCFATAPAILIQNRAPLSFFKDLYDLLSTGQIKRIVGGKEYSVPLSLPSIGNDLQKSFPFIAYSFGLKVALESVGVSLTPLLQEKIKECGTVDQALRVALLESFGLSEEDLADEAHLSRIQMTPLLVRQTAVYYQKPSERAQKVSDWKKKLAKARLHFQTMTECTLLRSWEYTIASLCDVKTDFARWNLFIGLGIHPDRKGGVGECLYNEVEAHLQKTYREIEHLTAEYEQQLGVVEAIEAIAQNTVSEMRLNQLKAEWTSHNLTANSILERKNEAVKKREGLIALFSSLIEQYDQKLQEHFQELFDPALLGEEAHLHDDSPAGFRLVYKHGRNDASQWTSINDGESYVHSLRDFFSRVESDLVIPESVEREIVSQITTRLIQMIQEPSFLALALERSKEMGRRSPWDYISGGTLQALLQAYWNRDRPFTESKIIPHSEKELFLFLIQQDKKAPLLIHSPTHAFIFYPQMLSGVDEGWIEQGQREALQLKWSEEMQEHLAHRVSQKLVEKERALFIHLYRQKPVAETNLQFRANLIESLGAQVKNGVSLVDSVLYEQTPLFTEVEAKEAIRQIFLFLGKNEKIDKLNGSFFGIHDLIEIVKGLLLQKLGKGISSVDWDQRIVDAAEKLGYKRTHSLLFADTNWSRWSFGFVLNPTTAELEVWRLNRTGTQGIPMSDWKEYVSQNNNSSWVILSKPEEYL